MLTRKQQELLLYIDAKLKEGGVSPSFEEMKEALDLKSKSGVHRLISALEERGFIRRLPNRARALEVLKVPDVRTAPIAANVNTPAVAPPRAANDVLDIPLHGRIAAGTPIEALQGTDTLPVPAALLGPGEHYALEVAGDSMVDEGILDGDYALIRKQETARDGEIVVALDQRGGSDPQDLPPRRPDDPPRPRQSPLRPPALPAGSGADSGPAGRVVAALLSRCQRASTMSS